MAANMDWTPDFCLACDRQTDGAVYCSEVCRLAEFERASSTPGSEASSPASLAPLSWPSSSRYPSNGFYLEPAYNFTQARPYGSHHSSHRTSSRRPQSSPAVPAKNTITPSSSQTSLCSMQSSLSTLSVDSTQLSDKARHELRAYASSFDQSRYHRRQSR